MWWHFNPVSRTATGQSLGTPQKKGAYFAQKTLFALLGSLSWKIFKIANFLISFVGFQFLSYSFYVDFKKFHHPVCVSSGAKQVKARRSLAAVNQTKIFKVGKLGNNSTIFDFSETCENLTNLKRFLNLTFSRFIYQRKYEKSEIKRTK